jgi:hypothetical protein
MVTNKMKRKQLGYGKTKKNNEKTPFFKRCLSHHTTQSMTPRNDREGNVKLRTPKT